MNMKVGEDKMFGVVVEDGLRSYVIRRLDS